MSTAQERHWAARRGKRGGVWPCRWGWGCTRWCPSRDVPGTGAPGCTGVRLCTVGRRTHVLGARSVHHPANSRLSVSSRRCLELRVSPPSATRILPSGLSPSVPEFHRLSRRIHSRFRRVWCERVADCDRRFGLSPTPEHVAGRKDTTLIATRPLRLWRPSLWTATAAVVDRSRRHDDPRCSEQWCGPSMPVRRRRRRRTPARSPSRADSSEIRPRLRPGCPGIRARSRRGRRCHPGHRRRSPRS